MRGHIATIQKGHPFIEVVPGDHFGHFYPEVACREFASEG